jgi:hypothetical protein
LLRGLQKITAAARNPTEHSATRRVQQDHGQGEQKKA